MRSTSHHVHWAIFAMALSWLTAMALPNAVAQVNDGLTIPAGQRRVALVIGNAGYTNLPDLSNSINDAMDVCAALRELNFETLCFKDIQTRREFRERIQEFKDKLGPGTAGLFYYAGHGVQIDGDNYLVPTTAKLNQKDDVDEEALKLRFLLTALYEVKNEFNLIIVDACRNSPFVQKYRSITRSASPATEALAGSLSRGLAPVSETPAGSLILFATAANEQASDGMSGDRNSPFAKHLLAYIRQPGLTVEAMIKKVSAAVQAETLKLNHKRQIPFTYGAFTGEFCFAGCTVPTKVQEAIARGEIEPNQLESELKKQGQPNTLKNRLRVIIPPAF